MTPIEYRPEKQRQLQLHFPGCWRWKNHWQCAVGLVEELSEILREIQARRATVRESGSSEIVISDELCVRIEGILREVEE